MSFSLWLSASYRAKVGAINDDSGHFHSIMRLHILWFEPIVKDKYRGDGKGRRCCCGGQNLLQFLARLPTLQKDNLKKRLNSYYSSNRPSADSAERN